VLAWPKAQQKKASNTASPARSSSARLRAPGRLPHSTRLVKLVGAAYLLYLVVRHFTARHGSSEGAAHRRRRPGSAARLATVVKVELTDIVFAIDSILVAVAMSPKTW